MFGKIKKDIWILFYLYLNSALTPQVTDFFNCCLNQNIFEDSSYCRPVWHQLMKKSASGQ